MKKLLALQITTCFLLFWSISVNAQESVISNAYINKVLIGKLAILQNSACHQKNRLSLKEIKTQYCQNLSFFTIYNLAKRGKVIKSPFDEKLYSAFSFLIKVSQLYSLQGHVYEQIINYHRQENIESYFYVPIENETMPSFYQSAVNPVVHCNGRLLPGSVKLTYARKLVYKTPLVDDIKTAYHNYNKLYGLLGLLKQTEILLEKNLGYKQQPPHNEKFATVNVFMAQK